MRRALVVLVCLLPAVVTGAQPLEVVRHPVAAAARVVAIGDLHGDLAAARAALRLAGATDAAGAWIGGKLVVVQTGDQVDRGDDDREILDLFDRLAVEAARAGGAVIALNGNHELMNAGGDFRYVTPGGFAEFGGQKARRAAFEPGGPVALQLAARPIYAIVGDTLFVHGGVVPAAAQRLEELDREARAWLRGGVAHPPAALTDSDGPLWSRRYGGAAGSAECDDAATVLDRFHLRRMVVGHTVQPAINSVCDGTVWRIDVGLAKEYGGPLQVLVIENGAARVLTPPTKAAP